MQSQELSGGENLSKILWDPPWLHGEEARGDEITIGGRLGGVKDIYYLVERPESKAARATCSSFTNFLKGVTAESNVISKGMPLKSDYSVVIATCIASDFAIG